MQAITKEEAKNTARKEHLFAEEPARGLIDLILKS
jgi:hypothetical protein